MAGRGFDSPRLHKSINRPGSWIAVPGTRASQLRKTYMICAGRSYQGYHAQTRTPAAGPGSLPETTFACTTLVQQINRSSTSHATTATTRRASAPPTRQRCIYARSPTSPAPTPTQTSATSPTTGNSQYSGNPTSPANNPVISSRGLETPPTTDY